MGVGKALQKRLTTKVLVPHTSGPPLRDQRLTIVHPFYNEEERVKIQLENWRSYSNKVKNCINIIIADDCSGTPVHTFFEGEDIDFNLEIYRVKEDLKWNTPGALNMGIENSPTFWTLIMDSDCLLKQEDISKLLALRPDNGYTYWFNRKRISEIPVAKDHTRFLPCSILFNKTAYNTIGGFDEDFTGSRSGGYMYFDNDFSHRLLEAGYFQGVLQDVIIHEYLEDVVGPNIQQKTGVTRDIQRVNKSLWYAKIRGEIPRNTEHMRFEWEKTFEYRRKACSITSPVEE